MDQLSSEQKRKGGGAEDRLPKCRQHLISKSESSENMVALKHLWNWIFMRHACDCDFNSTVTRRLGAFLEVQLKKFATPMSKSLKMVSAEQFLEVETGSASLRHAVARLSATMLLACTFQGMSHASPMFNFSIAVSYGRIQHEKRILGLGAFFLEVLSVLNLP